MRHFLLTAAFLAAVSAAPVLRADLTRAKAEPNLERRARLALDNAEMQFRTAVTAGKAGDWPATQAALQEMGESVDYAHASLKATGKNPRNSRHYKNLEVKLRGLVKRLDDFHRTLDFEQRETVAPLLEHLRQLHDQVLQSVLTPKKK